MKEFKPVKKILTTEKVVITMRIDIKKLELLDKTAINNDISRNELIIQCIDFALESLKKE